MNAEQHCRYFFGGHLDQMVAAKAEQRGNLVGHLVVVRRQADAPRTPRLRDVGMQAQV